MESRPALSSGGFPGAAQQVEARTRELGRELLAVMARAPSPFGDRLHDLWLTLWAVESSFRTALLSFVDVLAALDFDRDGRLTARLAREYLGAPFHGVGPLLRLLLRAGLSPVMPRRLSRWGARWLTRAQARRFIAAGGPEGAGAVLETLSGRGGYASFDVVGEHVVSQVEADLCRDRYLALIRRLARHPDAGRTTPGGTPRLQVSVKLSALTAHFDPADPEGTLERVRAPFEVILEAARQAGIAVAVDMEEYAARDLIWEIVTRVLGPGSRFAGWPGAGVVVQAYLADAMEFTRRVIAWARTRGAIEVRLVRGAYWDYETLLARQMGWPPPVLLEKPATDVQFEGCAALLLEAYPAVFLAIASHNVRSHACAEALRERLELPAGSVEHQTLYGMADRLVRALGSLGWPVREYVPLGDLLPGMAYLVRRVLENASQAGFLLQCRAGARADDLLSDPRLSLAEETGRPAAASPAREGGQPFANHPPAQLHRGDEREAFARALEHARRRFGGEYPLSIAGRTVDTTERVISLNPSDPDPARPVAIVYAAGAGEAGQAIAAANGGWPAWRSRPLPERAATLRRAANLVVAERDELAAWIVHEAGKNWAGALADADEAIDYLRYYAWQAERHADLLSRSYAPRGVVGVISPWNFPLAIPCGMASAALVMGNAVILKSAEEAPLVGHLFVELLHRAGVPQSVAIHLPGLGETAGRALVESPDVDMIAFTGSRAVGTWIYETAARVRLTKGGLKHVVAEMGGKNAIVVFADADLDEAVAGILQSAFGYANQKCSACSRVLIHRPIYGRLLPRLVEGARSLPGGRADEPGTVITPLITGAALERVRAAAGEARCEGRVLLDALETAAGSPWTLGPLLVELAPERLAEARTAQEEIFGPVLAIVPFETEEEAVRDVNGTVYGLTAGVFSRSLSTIRRVARAIRAGNVYVNREITGARVAIEPFGGMGLSGTGPKAGGEEYIWAFVRRREGLRRGEPPRRSTGQEGTPPAMPELGAWDVDMAARLAVLERAAAFLAARDHPGLAEAVRQVGVFAEEIAGPQPTRQVPGQENWIDWHTPRGVGAVVTGDGGRVETLAGMVAGALLAGNGVLVIPAEGHRQDAGALVRGFHHAGVPTGVLALWSGGDVPVERLSFAVVDLCQELAQALRMRLAARHPGQKELRALITLADGPRPGEPGFLRRLALPKLIAIRTVRHGAELALPEPSQR